jgi:hypothetical protein
MPYERYSHPKKSDRKTMDTREVKVPRAQHEELTSGTFAHGISGMGIPAQAIHNVHQQVVLRGGGHSHSRHIFLYTSTSFIPESSPAGMTMTYRARAIGSTLKRAYG